MIRKALANKLTVFLRANLVLGVMVVLLSGCSGTKYLGEGELLYTGAELVIKSEEKILKKLELSTELESVISPTPNQVFLGSRGRLWFHNRFDTVAGKKGLKRYLKMKVGKPPVLYDKEIPIKTNKALSGKLLSLGYLNATVNHQVNQKNKKVSIEYKVDLSKQYFIDTLLYEAGTHVLEQKIKNEALVETVLKRGNVFNVDLLEEERNRIGRYLKNEGFYYFTASDLIFKVDSGQGNNTVKILLQTKKGVSSKSFEKQRINNIYVYADYSLEKDSILRREKAEVFEKGLFYIDPDQQFKSKVICKSIFFKKGTTYRVVDHDLTLKRLYELNVFKFINVQFKPAEDDSVSFNALDVYIYLSPYLTRSLRAEFELTSKSNSFVGPGLLTDIRNRNLFHGAELLVLNLNTGFESQVFNSQNNLNSYEFGANLSLIFPRFLLPFPINFSLKQEIPKTSLMLGYHNLNRAGYYSANTASASFGYRWKETKEKTHEIRPITINYLKLGRTTAEFDTLMEDNPSLKLSLQEQFIAGLTYSFEYSNQINKPNGNFFYLSTNADIAGNLLNVFSHSVTNQEEGAQKVFGLPFSQYAKFDLDYRYSLKTSRKSSLLTRLIAGVGIPYGNAAVLPYMKQFFIGGSNSIRAFRTRSIGPGAIADTVQFLGQSGDIKLEANIEYRYEIYKIFKGAFFIDAGNIWLIKSDDIEKQKGVFNQSTFLKQMAVGTGAGLRLDASFFVLRFDLAFPLRIPYNEQGNRWVMNEFAFEKKDWRKKNLVLNVAIGYPF